MRHHYPGAEGAPSHHGPSPHGHGPRSHGPRKRFFDYGELRLLILAMIAGRPRHGYEIIKDIEERFEGRYAPSPGVIYPTLAWLDDMGYATIEPSAGGRKLTRITAEGEAFLTANRAAAEELLTRQPPGRPHGIPPEIEAALDRLKAALRAHVSPDPARIAAIAEAIDSAAAAIKTAAEASDEQG